MVKRESQCDAAAYKEPDGEAGGGPDPGEHGQRSLQQPGGRRQPLLTRPQTIILIWTSDTQDQPDPNGDWLCRPVDGAAGGNQAAGGRLG